ncbi:MAG: hypothetical protein IT429_13570 [Gemmataceae bacterium]|nr:hypothetical protein [Gemmataceae bacterium]
MNVLDDPARLALDASGMFGHIRAVGPEIVRAWEASEGLELPAGAGAATSVVVAGMGGSATAGDYFAALCTISAEVPVAVVRGHSLPNYVSARTLVVVSSYSGTTEEALACYDDAWRRDAAILAVTTGGRLAERAAADGVAVYQLAYESAPRAAIAHSLAPLLRLGARLGLCSITTEEVEGAAAAHAAVAAGLVPAVPAAANRAKQVGAALQGRVALVLGAESLAPVAARFKNQLAENGKVLGAAEALPEAGHNLIVGLGTAAEGAKGLALVTLESALYDARIRRRFEAIAQEFAETGIPVHRVDVGGARPLEQLLVGTAWGDYVSCYLALANGVDPTPIPQIERLRAALAG